MVIGLKYDEVDRENFPELFISPTDSKNPDAERKLSLIDDLLKNDPDSLNLWIAKRELLKSMTRSEEAQLAELKIQQIKARSTAIPEGFQEKERDLALIDDLLKKEPESLTLWRKKRDLLRELGMTDAENQAFSKIVDIEEKVNFNENISKKIYINSIEVRNLEFFGSFKWDLKNNINILLGKNGYGKSHLLTLLIAALQ